MASARSWLEKLQPRDKLRGSSTRKKDSVLGRDDTESFSDDETPSNITKQRVEAAKQYIEKHYKEQMISKRKERRSVLEKKLADADVSEEDQSNLLKFLEQKETKYMRIQRHKMGVDDFELLTMIGKGAFGETVKRLFSVMEWMGKESILNGRERVTSMRMVKMRSSPNLN